MILPSARFIVLICLLVLFAPALCLAGSAQVELTEPVLPIPHGKPANGNASLVWVGGGNLYDSAGNLGGTFPIGTIRNGQLYFHASIFTWIQNPDISSFKPKRVFYTLEPGYNWVKNDIEFRFFIKHQSFHNVDSILGTNESYELIGINYRRLTNPELSLRIGKYVDERVVDYDWDIAASATLNLPRGFGYESYIHAWIHRVTESGNTFGRDGFTDWAAEYGYTINDGFKVFVRYEFLNDLTSFGGRSDHHVMLGPKYIW